MLKNVARKLWLGVFFIFSIPWCMAQQPLILSRTVGLMGDIGTRVIVEAYRRIGIPVLATTFPGARALIMSNSGLTDGEVFRRSGIQQEYSNLIMIPVPIIYLEGMAFTKNPQIQISEWQSLAPYTIDLEIGIKWAEKVTTGLNTQPVTHLSQAFKKLNLNRTDIVLASRIDGLQTIKQLNLKGIILLEPPLVSEPLYHYLHISNSALVLQITAVLKEMEREGLMEKYASEALTNAFK
jgi:polar amino acid transport system substrate-binding protein